jgi:hypothetical protein
MTRGDASRLARNGRDRHHLLEPCGLVEARVVDLDGVSDPCRPDDRLLPGMKCSISEVEPGVIRARMLDAARAKARSGELRISVPIGYVWHRDPGPGFDPDIRLQRVIRLVFERFRQPGSARRTHLSLAAGQVVFPRPSDGRAADLLRLDADPRSQCHRAAEDLLSHAGVHVDGKSGTRVTVVDGRARKSCGHGKPPEDREMVIRDHHEGHIDRAEQERTRSVLAADAYGRAGGQKSGRGGRALLSGMLSLRRLRPWSGGRLHRRAAGPPRPSLRPAEPRARPPALSRLRRVSRGRRDRGGDTARGGADGHRGGFGGRADAQGGRGRAPARRRARPSTGQVWRVARRTALRRLRS